MKKHCNSFVTDNMSHENYKINASRCSADGDIWEQDNFVSSFSFFVLSLINKYRNTPLEFTVDSQIRTIQQTIIPIG